MDETPLTGLRIVVTRATDQTSSLVAGLQERGAEVVELPTIAIADPADGGAALQRSLADLSGVDWLVITSANGADRVATVLAHGTTEGEGAAPAGLLRRAGVRLAAIGPGTSRALVAHGLRPDLVPERFVAEGLLEVFPDPPPGGGRVLVAQAAGARPVLADGLRSAGWQVEVVEAYRTVHAPAGPDRVRAAAGADMVTFTSGSTVSGYLAAVGIDPPPRAVACIGPITARAAREAGLTVDVEATEHTVTGLVEAIVSHISDRRA